MAIATNSAHVSRALEFYNKPGKYFSIGKTTPWEDDGNPPAPNITDYKIEELVALKRADNVHLIVPDNVNGTIIYRDSKWRIVQPEIKTTTTYVVGIGTTTVPIQSLSSIVVGNKLRVHNTYEGVILSVNTQNNSVILDTPSPIDIPAGAEVLGGAYVENAKYVYIDCFLNYDQFPIITYRQVGIHTSVTPDNEDILRSAEYSTLAVNEYNSLGVLEILDNRHPTVREIDQKESIGIIIEF